MQRISKKKGPWETGIQIDGRELLVVIDVDGISFKLKGLRKGERSLSWPMLWRYASLNNAALADDTMQLMRQMVEKSERVALAPTLRSTGPDGAESRRATVKLIGDLLMNNNTTLAVAFELLAKAAQEARDDSTLFTSIRTVCVENATVSAGIRDIADADKGEWAHVTFQWGRLRECLIEMANSDPAGTNYQHYAKRLQAISEGPRNK